MIEQALLLLTFFVLFWYFLGAKVALECRSCFFYLIDYHCQNILVSLAWQTDFCLFLFLLLLLRVVIKAFKIHIFNWFFTCYQALFVFIDLAVDFCSKFLIIEVSWSLVGELCELDKKIVPSRTLTRIMNELRCFCVAYYPIKI